jgi:Ring finger domain
MIVVCFIGFGGRKNRNRRVGQLIETR